MPRRRIAYFLVAIAAMWTGGQLARGAETAEIEVRCRCSGSWFVADSPSFSIWTKSSTLEASRLARHCEQLRRELIANWSLTTDIAASWEPRCAIVLHGGQAEYRRSFPAEPGQSVGCTTLTRDGGRIVFRRIDLRSDTANWESNALPHELTHVLLADLSPGRPLPGWLNEGLAMLAEEPQLQEERRQLLRTALRAGRLPPLSSVVHPRPAFTHSDAETAYSVSHSLVQLLEERGERAQLLRFASALETQSIDRALSTIYGIEGGLAELDQIWRRELDEHLVALQDDRP